MLNAVFSFISMLHDYIIAVKYIFTITLLYVLIHLVMFHIESLPPHIAASYAESTPGTEI